MTISVLWPDSTVPSNTDALDPGGITTGTGVLFGRTGKVTGVRFIATDTISGNYAVSIWRLDLGTQSSGTLLATKNFTSGDIVAGEFNTINFDAPVVVHPALAYVVGLWSDSGHFVSTVGYFSGNSVGSITGVYAWGDGEDISPTAPDWTTMTQAVFTEFSNELPTTGLGNSYFVSPVFDDEFTGPFYLNAGGPNTAPGWFTDGSPGISTGTLLLFAVDGFVTGIRYYAGDTQEVTVALWQGATTAPLAAGDVLVERQHTADSIGWQMARFDEPFPVSAGIPYIASRFHPEGYDFVGGFFTAAQGELVPTDPVYGPGDADNISSLLDPAYTAGWNGPAANGRFGVDSVPTWPGQSPSDTYYGVDAEFFSSFSANLTATGPAATLSLAALEADAVLEAVGPAPSLTISTFGNPIYEQMIRVHPYLGPLLVESLQCLCEKVSLLPNAPQNCCFRVGTEVVHDAGINEDQCCEGIAYVALGDLFPSSDSFPEQDIVRQAASNCTPPAWGVYIKIGIIRCIPVGGFDPLDCDDWNSATLQNIYDMYSLMRTACCIRDFVISDPKFTGWSVVIDRQVQGNPLGGCVERYFTMTVQFPNCEC